MVAARAAAAALLLSASVAAAQVPPQRLQFRGFAVTAPATEQWTLLERNDASALLGRRTGSAAHTFVAIVMSDTIPEKDLPLWNTPQEFFDFIKKLKRASLDPSRHTFIDDEFSPPLPHVLTCMRYRVRAADRGASQARGVALPLEIAGVSCTHPQSLRTIVDVSYSERGGPSADSARMRAEAEQFIASLTFADIK